MDQEQLDLRFRNRRQIAKISFGLMSLTLLGLIGAALYSDEMAQRIQNIQWLIGTATGLWSTLILGYYIAASYEQGRMTNDER